MFNGKFWGWENPLWSWITTVNMAVVVLFFMYNVVAYSIPNDYYAATIMGLALSAAFSWITYMWAKQAYHLSKSK